MGSRWADGEISGVWPHLDPESVFLDNDWLGAMGLASAAGRIKDDRADAGIGPPNSCLGTDHPCPTPLKSAYWSSTSTAC